MTLLEQLDKKQQNIQEKKHEYCLDIRQEILRRDISEEKIKRALGLKFELSRFKRLRLGDGYLHFQNTV